MTAYTHHPHPAGSPQPLWRDSSKPQNRDSFASCLPLPHLQFQTQTQPTHPWDAENSCHPTLIRPRSQSPAPQPEEGLGAWQGGHTFSPATSRAATPAPHHPRVLTPSANCPCPALPPTLLPLRQCLHMVKDCMPNVGPGTPDQCRSPWQPRPGKNTRGREIKLGGPNHRTHPRRQPAVWAHRSNKASCQGHSFSNHQHERVHSVF